MIDDDGPERGLLHGNTGVSAVPSTDAVKELLSGAAKRVRNRETEKHEVQAVTSRRGLRNSEGAWIGRIEMRCMTA